MDKKKPETLRDKIEGVIIEAAIIIGGGAILVILVAGAFTTVKRATEDSVVRVIVK